VRDRIPIDARTLTVADARRIDTEARTPPPPRVITPTTGDPLRVERPSAGVLDVTLWPVGPGETCRAVLEFVTPLRGSGRERAFVDPLGESAPAPGTTPTDGVARPPLTVRSEMLVRSGEWVLASMPTNLRLAPAPEGLVRLVREPAIEYEASADRRSEDVTFRNARPTSAPLVVAGGGLLSRVALWRFDPTETLREHGIDPQAGWEVVLVPRGTTAHLAPERFSAVGEASPVSARVSGRASVLSYDVEVRAGDTVVAKIPVRTPLQVSRVPREDADAVCAWHRARIVDRALTWAGSLQHRLDQALEYAVEAGVLVPGTAAIALPDAERRNLPRASRRQYDWDAIPLGAPSGAADLTSPPAGSVR
jgi:hypothetical protein